MVDDSTATDEPPVAELQSLEATLSECNDEAGVAHTAEALAHIAWITGDADEAMARMQRGLVSSYRANERVPLSRMAVAYLSILVAGPMPVDEAIRKCEAVGPIAQRSALVEISLKANAALLFAMGDGVTVARHSLEDAESIQAALGQPPWVARVPRIAGSIELMDGDPVRAIERAGRDLDFLLQGAHPAGIDAGVIVARALCDAGRHDEAVELTRRLLDSLAAVDTSEAPEITDGEIEAVRARALAAVGRPGDATASIARSDASPPSHVRFVQRADRLLDTALACSMLDELGDARRRSEEALRLYREKGARLPALRARSVLESTTKNL
jgi:tetratricopeptide (TPR) repeat protein